MDYHILDVGKKGNKANVVYHIPVLSGYEATIKESIELKKGNGFETASILPASRLPETDLSDLNAGSIVEVSKNVELSRHATIQQKKEVIEGQYSSISASVANQIPNIFGFWMVSGSGA